jgi:hypothetical protein
MKRTKMKITTFQQVLVQTSIWNFIELHYVVWKTEMWGRIYRLHLPVLNIIYAFHAKNA